MILFLRWKSAVRPHEVKSFCRATAGLEFSEILPEDARQYDKMRPPKKGEEATTVFFHVTVMGLDSIDENSMVRIFLKFRSVASESKLAPSLVFSDVRSRYIFRPNVERSSIKAA